MRISDWSSDVCSSDLWYIDLATPERVISAPTISGTAMLLSSVIPATGSDCASAAGSGFLNAINLFTGTSPESGGYLGNGGTVTDADGNGGTLGGVGVTGGMPTEVNEIGRASGGDRGGK